MKTHNPIIVIMLACLLMLASACGKKSIRGVSGGEDLFSSESNHEVAGHDEDPFDDALVQLEEALFEDGGDALADGKGATMMAGGEQNPEGNASDGSPGQFEETLLGDGSEAGMLEALAAGGLDEETPLGDGSEAGMLETLAAGDLDDEKAMVGLVESGGKGAASIFPASPASGVSDSSEEAFETEYNKGMSQTLTRDPSTASGRFSDDSATDENAREIDGHFSKALRDVLFAYDSWRLSEQSHRTLEANAAWLKAHPHARITIEGHCDERGTQSYNYVLGKRRAETTKKYLSHLGVPSYQMMVVSYGKDRPVCHVFSAACFQSNRRSHFSIDVNTASRD